MITHHSTIGAAARPVLIDVAFSIHCVSMPVDPLWADRLPRNVSRLLSRLSLIGLPERDATLVMSKLSRRDLRGDDVGARTLSQVDAWLTKYGLALGE
jgi:hypothetical protein